MSGEAPLMAAALSGWQSIETMPDDVWVLLYLPDEGNCGTIHAGRNLKVGNGYLKQVAHYHASDLTPATHWMPLPPPPGAAS